MSTSNRPFCANNRATPEIAKFANGKFPGDVSRLYSPKAAAYMSCRERIVGTAEKYNNGNLSNGIMFPFEAQWNGTKLDLEYLNQRAKLEPLYEITQIKGDGETQPLLSPDDEFADY